ncbi:monoamine oxidase [Arachidicoccus rhizosphaerae]|uniref:Monoamine oxidase n=1 Tax=Arachidicoccus rhizosphaerae TaxID=551991 RepID=A0A1H4AX00_9BACT|nr:NAD(P)/FAD-dependent oxidoreductase [Arachidicoccus rhizosphaerae]SEA40390.1 monoamine oxidase [Arachidicoccus rhizosphaerae]
MSNSNHLIIIGGGLSGLVLAYLATQKKRQITILEATDRLGGRIQTYTGVRGTPMELGATWFSEQHPHLLDLLTGLGLNKFPQYDRGKSLFQTKSFEPAQAFEIPSNTTPSYRFKGGSETVITALQRLLPSGSIRLNSKIIEIRQSPEMIMAVSENGQVFQADQMAICLPPQVAASMIRFPDGMPAPLLELLPEVQTWMAGALKFVIEYDRPFWRQAGYSGMLYSHAGIITEMYDHCTEAEDRFALTGFLNGGSKDYTRQVREKYVIRQLTDLLGPEAGVPVYYQDKIWNQPELLAGKQVFQEAHFNNGHPAFEQTYLDNRLVFAGSETSLFHPGYMEGAVIAANRAASQLLL